MRILLWKMALLRSGREERGDQDGRNSTNEENENKLERKDKEI